MALLGTMSSGPTIRLHLVYVYGIELLTEQYSMQLHGIISQCFLFHINSLILLWCRFLNTESAWNPITSY